MHALVITQPKVLTCINFVLKYKILMKCKSKQSIDEEKQENHLIPISCLSVNLH